MGLKSGRDRLCLIQISDSDLNVHAVHFRDKDYSAPNLKKLLSDESRVKIMHFARFDARIIKQYLGVELKPIFCTHIASRIARTYTDNHSLKDLCRDLLGIQLSKQAGCSDWGVMNLTPEQVDYASKDVLYLHKIKEILVSMLIREDRFDLVTSIFEFVKTRVNLDIRGWGEIDPLSHHRDK